MLFGVPTCLNSLPAAQQDRLTAQLHLKAAIAQPPRHEETPWHPERWDAGKNPSVYILCADFDSNKFSRKEYLSHLESLPESLQVILLYYFDLGKKINLWSWHQKNSIHWQSSDISWSSKSNLKTLPPPPLGSSSAIAASAVAISAQGSKGRVS